MVLDSYPEAVGDTRTKQAYEFMAAQLDELDTFDLQAAGSAIDCSDVAFWLGYEVSPSGMLLFPNVMP